MSTKDSNPTTRLRATRAVLFGAALGAAALLAACDSGGATDASSAAVAVHTREQPNLGTVLVDADGKTLYFADQESDGTIHCVDECLSFWHPATSSDRSGSVPDIDVLHRADNGKEQLTYQGKPLYTFQQDHGTGDAKGDRFEDEFGGTHFVWHAAVVDGSATPTPSSGDSGGGVVGGY
ncbi:MAG TPA: hypothetical protein VH969_18590 [Actinophytocola sp.]|jgi:predicted lipoprotein with Yx(FWY)xxD motif|uniref:COG4315 family predicted lipoprotein n=1 Tax=Actinophytocola sp. TaxID=1872138 RepID=UPI002F9598F1